MQRAFVFVAFVVLGVGSVRAEIPPQWLTGPEHGLPGVDGLVYTTVEYDDGTGPALYAGGHFTMAGGVPAANIAKWDGSGWQALGAGITGSVACVNALTVHNGHLIAGGFFDAAGEVAAHNVAQWDGDDWTPVADGIDRLVYAVCVYNNALVASDSGGALWRWAGQSAESWRRVASAGSDIRALTVYNGELVLAGSFTAVGSVSANHVAKWNGSRFLALGSGTNYPARALTVYNGRLIVGGSFDSAGGVSANSVAAWNGTMWAPLGSGVQDPDAFRPADVYALRVFNGQLIAGGFFSQAGDVSVNSIACWDGAAWASLGVGVAAHSYVDVLGAHGDELIVGGRFLSAGGLSAAHVARWDGARWASLGSGAMPGPVRAFQPYDHQLLSGGDFGVCAWNGATASQYGNPWCPYICDGRVCALETFGDALIAGGHFGALGGVGATQIAQWDGATWSRLGDGLGETSAGDAVLALTGFDGQLIAAGSFWGEDEYENGVSSWNGSEWLPLGEGTVGRAEALAIYNGSLIAAGAFTATGGINVVSIAAWDGSSWVALASDIDGPVAALTIYGDALIAAGGFTTVDGVNANHVARWDGVGWAPLDSGTDGAVNALTVYGDDLIAGGCFTSAGGVSASNVARWNGATWEPLGIGTDGRVFALRVYEEQLVVGGEFMHAGGQVAAYWARWAGPFVDGDLNCDRLINVFDIDPFVLALTDSAAYDALHPNCDYTLADINRDGLVNVFDIDPFVRLLVGD